MLVGCRGSGFRQVQVGYRGLGFRLGLGSSGVYFVYWLGDRKETVDFFRRLCCRLCALEQVYP